MDKFPLTDFERNVNRKLGMSLQMISISLLIHVFFSVQLILGLPVLYMEQKWQPLCVVHLCTWYVVFYYQERSFYSTLSKLLILETDSERIILENIIHTHVFIEQMFNFHSMIFMLLENQNTEISIVSLYGLFYCK